MRGKRGRDRGGPRRGRTDFGVGHRGTGKNHPGRGHERREKGRGRSPRDRTERDRRRTLLVDASAFGTLAGVGSTSLLDALGERVLAPASVVEEITDDPAANALERARKAGWLRVERPTDDSASVAAAHLGVSAPSGDRERDGGDVELLALSLATEGAVVVTDDAPLRTVCKALSIPVSGSVGVLIRSVERGDVDAAEATDELYAMDEVGARVSASLIKHAERLIEQAAEK